MASAMPCNFISASFSIVCSASTASPLAASGCRGGPLLFRAPEARSAAGAPPRAPQGHWTGSSGASVVVVAAAQVAVERQRCLDTGLRQLFAVEVVLQNCDDAAVRERPVAQGTCARELESRL